MKIDIRGQPLFNGPFYMKNGKQYQPLYMCKPGRPNQEDLQL